MKETLDKILMWVCISGGLIVVGTLIYAFWNDYSLFTLRLFLTELIVLIVLLTAAKLNDSIW